MESTLTTKKSKTPSRSSRILEAAVAFLGALVIVTASPRLSALLFVALYFVVAAFSRHTRRFGVVPTALVGFLFFSLLPIDISFRTAPGAPHFARVISSVGDPSLGFRTDQEGAMQGLHRGEFVLMANCTGAYQPKWILVW